MLRVAMLGMGGISGSHRNAWKQFEDAKVIALTHAGLTLGQVSRLRVEYDPEEGVPRYEVEFHQGQWEYAYEIDARTGQILSFEKER